MYLHDKIYANVLTRSLKFQKVYINLHGPHRTVSLIILQGKLLPMRLCEFLCMVTITKSLSNKIQNTQ